MSSPPNNSSPKPASRCRRSTEYFTSKDELLLAVIGDAMTDACERWAQAAADLPDPLARLQYYITATLESLDGENEDAATTRFIVSTRWRLQRNFLKELAEAEKPFVELLRDEVNAAIEARSLNPAVPEWDSWLLAELVRSGVPPLRVCLALRR